MRKIIVITPVKNEAWILESFLKITSEFADAIIIANQQSTDESVEIIRRFPKAIVIQNDDLAYNEAYRQNILLQKARELYPGTKIILALDADELLAASSFVSNDWLKMQGADVGSVFYFEKPDIYGNLGLCVRNYNNDYPMGFVDDDSIEHKAKLIHSIRIPRNENHTKVFLEDIKFLHVSYLRLNVQRSKYRFYTVKENVLRINPWFRRRRRYRSPNHLLPSATLSITQSEWFNYPEWLHISLASIKDEDVSWYDIEVLEELSNCKSMRFWLDDIWDINWPEYAKKYYLDNGKRKIATPPRILQLILKQLDKIY